MAKQIKALKCPQCGSTKKQAVKEDHYICNNCGTEYFLDNDDVNVNIRHNHNYPTSTPAPVANRKALLIVFVSLAFLFTLVPILLGIFSNNSNSSAVQSYKTKNYRERVSDFVAVNSGESGIPLLVFKIERNYTGRERRPAEFFIRFYDPIKEEVLNEVPMTNWNDDSQIYYYRTFSDGNLYFSPRNIPKVYRIIPGKADLQDATDNLFAEVPELASGMATVELVSERYGDGFEIMTNDGKKYYYFPLSKQLYSESNAMSKAAAGLESLLPGAVETTHFVFTEKSTDYKDEKIQLIKYWYKQNLGYPTNLSLSSRWHKKMIMNTPKKPGIYFGGSPIKYEKKLFTTERIIRFEDLTPDRLYFDTEIAYADSTDLYITGLPNANPDGNQFVQKLDVKTGEVLWSYTPSYSKYKLDKDFYKYDGGIVLRCFNYGAPGRINYIILLDENGKVIKEIDYDKLFQ